VRALQIIGAACLVALSILVACLVCWSFKC